MTFLNPPNILSRPLLKKSKTSDTLSLIPPKKSVTPFTTFARALNGFVTISNVFFSPLKANLKGAVIAQINNLGIALIASTNNSLARSTIRPPNSQNIPPISFRMLLPLPPLNKFFIPSLRFFLKFSKPSLILVGIFFIQSLTLSLNPLIEFIRFSLKL